MSGTTIGELREEARREFWAFLERQAEWQVRRAVACRGVDPVSRKTVAAATAELALIAAARPEQRGLAQDEAKDGSEEKSGG